MTSPDESPIYDALVVELGEPTRDDDTPAENEDG